MNGQFYTTIDLTENEHYFYEDKLRQYCVENNLNLMYYRKMKTGHIIMKREFKISGTNRKVRSFKNQFEQSQGFIFK
jgi:hypothetical protein